MSAATNAVFLSYARDDAAAARRIADALRGFGVEVWFDQNELRGGDAWDANIRQQIRGCGLFVAVISGTTQARGEGYFRREWKLAVERTHDMAASRAFLLPVAIDETTEAQADVPEEFMRVQWTRLPHGVPTPQFVEQVKRLLAGKSMEAGRPRPAQRGSAFAEASANKEGAALPAKPRGRTWLWFTGAAVLAAAVAGVIVFRQPASPASVAAPAPKPAVPVVAAVDPKSIAVLPFANFSADKENEYFADGLQDEVITALAKIHDLKVISRTSVMAYRNPEGRNLRKIAADLGVATVLEGSVQRAGNQVHLNVQLIDARNDDHLWADSYTEDMTDIFSVESRLATAVTAALKATLSPEEKSLIARRPTENQAAYELYLRARQMDENLAQFAGREEVERVIALYDQASALDPSFLQPHVQASMLHGLLYWFAALDPTPDRLAKAWAEVQAAQRLAPDAPETRLAEGSFEYTCNNDWAKALQDYRDAEASLPNDAQLHYRIGLAYRRLGRFADSIAEFERAVALNPLDAQAASALVETNCALRRYGRALEEARQLTAVFPDNAGLARFRAMAQYELDGDRPAFVAAMRTLPLASLATTRLALSYYRAMLAGDAAAAEQALAAPGLQSVPNLDGTIGDPVTLLQAMFACLRERKEDARQLAEKAIATYRTSRWSPRQEEWAQLGIARAEVYAGRTDEALRTAQGALAGELKRDAFSGFVMRYEYGRILVMANRPEEALAVLREVVAQPMPDFTCGSLREDPVWSRLKDDPRFEQILKSAKPL